MAILVSIVQPPRNGNTAPSMASSMECSATDVALRERRTTSLTDSVHGRLPVWTLPAVGISSEGSARGEGHQTNCWFERPRGPAGRGG